MSRHKTQRDAECFSFLSLYFIYVRVFELFDGNSQSFNDGENASVNFEVFQQSKDFITMFKDSHEFFQALIYSLQNAWIGKSQRN